MTESGFGRADLRPFQICGLVPRRRGKWASISGRRSSANGQSRGSNTKGWMIDRDDCARDLGREYARSLHRPSSGRCKLRPVFCVAWSAAKIASRTAGAVRDFDWMTAAMSVGRIPLTNCAASSRLSGVFSQ
jgi:hypothetical protein